MRPKRAVSTIVALGVVFLAASGSARASEPSRDAAIRVVLMAGDTLRAIRVRPQPFDMFAIEMPDSTVRYVAANKIQAVFDSSGVNRTAAVVKDRESVPPGPGREWAARGGRSKRSGPAALTWRGRPLAETKSFLITESALLYRLDDNPYQSGDSPYALSFDLGWMKNVSARDAVGFSGYALASDPTRLGIRARYRRWLSRSTSVDISPGVLLGGEDNNIEYDPPGFVLGATWNAGDLIAFTVDAEYAKNRDLVHDTLPLVWKDRTDIAWRGGAKLGSGLGVLAAAGLFGLVLAIAASGGFD